MQSNIVVEIANDKRMNCNNLKHKCRGVSYILASTESYKIHGKQSLILDQSRVSYRFVCKSFCFVRDSFVIRICGFYQFWTWKFAVNVVTTNECDEGWIDDDVMHCVLVHSGFVFLDLMLQHLIWIWFDFLFIFISNAVLRNCNCVIATNGSISIWHDVISKHQFYRFQSI